MTAISLQPLVIAGATGYIGRSLVPALVAKGYPVTVVGRDKLRLADTFPGQPSLSYDELWGSKFDDAILINLATMNNNQAGSAEEFQAANAALPQRLANYAAQHGFKRMIHLTSFHSEEAVRDDAYAHSKRAGELALAERGALPVQLLRLPAVYKEGEYQGKLAIVSRVPGFLQSPLIGALSALRPTVNVQQVVEKIAALLEQPVDPARRDEFARDKESFAYRFLKRTMDLGFAFGVLIFFWWALLVAAVAIRINSKGPALFKQVRVGQYQKPFLCYKFRTMSLGTEQVGSHMVAASAITSVGGFLRRTKIDELPQIWNLIKGDPSLVGPRPCLPNQGKVIAWRERYGVYAVPPGITGLAQIRDIDMSMPEELAIADAEYMRQRTIIMDIKIFLATIFGAGQGDRVIQ